MLGVRRATGSTSQQVRLRTVCPSKGLLVSEGWHMTNLEDPVRRWTREIAQLRARAVRAGLDRQTPHTSALGEVLRDALEVCVNLVQEIAGARLECESLIKRVEAEKGEWEHLFANLPIPCICTGADGTILNANRSASLLLNVSTKRLDTRLLAHFIEDRSRFSDALRMAPMLEGADSGFDLLVRPRERAPIAVQAQVMRRTPLELGRLLWFFVPVGRAIPRAAAPLQLPALR